MVISSKPFRAVYVMNAIYGLAGSLIGIFIPVYLLQKNQNPANVYGFYLVFTISTLAFFFLANKICRLIGLRKTALLGYPFLFLYFFLLYTLDQYHTPFIILAAVNGFQTAFYWFPLHIWLTHMSREGSIGDDMGKFFAASQLVRLFAPVTGAFIVLFLGFKSLFLFAAGVYLISVIPLFYLPEFQLTEEVRIRRFFQLLRRYPQYIVAEIFENIRKDAEAIIWPVFIYLTFRDILSVGYIGTAAGIGGILFNLAVGKYTDKMDKRKLLGAGALIMALIWVCRFFAVTPAIAYLLTLAAAFFGILIMIPVNTIVYSIAKRENPPTFILFREFGVTLGRVILYSFALLTLSSVNNIFIFTSLACLGLFYLSRKDLEIAK